MKRRSLLKLLVGAAIGSQIPIELPTGAPLWNPHPRQLEFLNSPDNIAFYGIPYHQSNASAGTWLGIQRSAYPQFKSTK